MKHNKLLLLLLLSVLTVFAVSCDDDSNSPTSGTTGVVKQFTSSQGGTLSADDGTEILVSNGCIKKKDDNSDGIISFSIETNVKELPVSIPSAYKLIGGVVKFGPASFIFTEPLMVYLPASTLETLENVVILHYSESDSKWIEIPIADVDAVKKRLGASSFDLGYFAVAQIINGSAKYPVSLSAGKSGGIKLTHSGVNDYYYTLMVDSFVPKYSADANSGIVGSTSSTGSHTTGGPLSTTYMGGIPQGTYGIIISRVKRGTLSSLPGEREYYSNIISVNVGAFTSTLSWDWYNWSGWTTLSVGGGTYSATPPSRWPTATKPFGTGQFQATLSWTNTSSSNADLDLHLFGPDNLHVYFGNEYSNDNSIALDVDWMEEYGNATENIYSLSSMPKGDYSVYVNGFSGNLPKSFEVRIIRNGSIVNTIRGTSVIENTYSSDKSKMVLIQKFKI